MTDHDPLDELTSAHLDGATTPAEAARVAADPALLARVEEMRAVREAVARPTPADPANRERAIAAALAAYDAAQEETSDALPIAPVRPMAPVAARRGRSSRAWRVAGVAAAVAALVAIVPVLAALSSGSDGGTSEDMAISPTTAAPEPAERAAPPALPEAAIDSGAETTSTTAAAPVPQALGTFEDDEELVTAARAASPTLSAEDVTVPADPASCVDELVAALPPGTTVSLTATATLDGSPVAVVVTPDDVRIAGGDCTDVTVRLR